MRMEIDELTKFRKEPEAFTLREAAEWNNKLRTFQPFEADEQKLVTEQFVVLVTAIGQREGLMPGLTAYIIDELSFTLRIPLPT